ncbi:MULTISPECIES: hypothetical protein [Paenibacillus]|uniref:Uncharacterized protein n=1 Tax=Paenibacillus albilobatus TaxID=2716884 RepID=A0A919XJS2_9BACL|nr:MULTISPECIES: hypothetical protein [Paenibacillus]GIO32678.1 hypothetical protein J2TS6_38190 [Paenibacillus albilobatus]
MGYLLKLNGMSLLYAFVLFVHIELTMNMYRIERLTGWADTGKLIDAAQVLIFIGFTVLLFTINKRWTGKQKWRYVTTILWLPYLYVLIYSFAALYPITDPQEVPLPAVGLIALGEMLVFPLYVAAIQLFSRDFAASFNTKG